LIGLAFHLLIDFHGADKPTGYNRRFPNELTREGIYGQEWRTYTPQGAINNAIIPFTRFLAGPADYTPGVFDSKLSYGTSRAQQLALTVIYNSPLLCWADDPAVYLGSPALDIIRAMPTTWDETRVLAPSRIGELAAFARRKGNDWYLGIISAGDEKRLDLPLAFLGAGAFRGEIIGDDRTSPDRVLHSIAGFTAADTLPVLLQAKGGFVGRFVRAGGTDLGGDWALADGAVLPGSDLRRPGLAIRLPGLAIRPAGGYLQGPEKVRIVTKGAAAGAAAGARGAEAGLRVRYTTDGSLPDTRSTLYTGEFTVARPALVRATAGGADVVAQFLAAPAPVARPAGGIFIGQQAVRLSSRMPGEIRYTTDGSEPNAASRLFRDSMVLDASTMLKSRVFFAAGGASEIGAVRFQKVVPDAGLTTGGGVAGLRYGYYEGKWDSMPAFDRLTEIKHGVALLPSLDSIASRPNEYGLRFTGWITIPETGVYTFYTVSDDGSELYIGDN